MALIVLLAIGVNDAFGDNEANILVHEFGELLEGIEAEIQSIPIDSESFADPTDTIQSEMILSQIAYIDAFDEVIRKQIL